MVIDFISEIKAREIQYIEKPKNPNIKIKTKLTAKTRLILNFCKNSTAGFKRVEITKEKIIKIIISLIKYKI